MNRFSLALLMMCSVAARADVAVLTQHNNLSHTGANLEEKILTTKNVNTNTFGLLYTRPVDDQIYSQPLIATGVKIAGKGTHNLVILTTVNDSVYAFDAEDPAVTEPYWKRSFINPPGIVPPTHLDLGAIGACGGNYNDFTGNMGIASTPVIDPATETVYVIVRTKEPGNNFVQRLHALDLRTGQDRPNSPALITATYPGTGDGSVGGVLTFDPVRENARSGLVIVKGVVYICFAGHCDLAPYHGWILGYNAETLKQEVVYNSTPNGGDGGIWMSSEGLSADKDGNLFLSVGNGTVGIKGNPRDLTNRGESFLKLARDGSRLKVVSWFTPYNYQFLENGDIDLGSSGFTLIPGTTLAFSGGKQGIGYLVDRDNMGGLSYSESDTNIPQSFRTSSDQMHGGMVWWDGPTGSFGYTWPSSTFLQQYKFDRKVNKFVLPAFAQSAMSAPGGQPGGMLAISANGAKAGSGILWAVHQQGGDANHVTLPGLLHVYDAANVTHELWNSEQDSGRDAVGGFAKFIPPTVANGKVYLATFAGRLDVYGLASGWVTEPTVTPGGSSFTNSITVTLSDKMPGVSVYYTLDGTAPTTRSTVYSGPFVLTNSTLVKARAIKKGFADSGVTSAMFVNSALLGNGTGLKGEYFSNHDRTFDGPPTLTRTDATVKFAWGEGSPAPEISADHFTALWTGSVQPVLSDKYTFYTTTDDGVRLWVNNHLLIDDWHSQAPTESSGTITMIGQQKYNIRMEYYEDIHGAEASLSWGTPSLEKTIIPASQLYPIATPAPSVSLKAPPDGATYTGIASVTMTAAATTENNNLARLDFYSNGVLLSKASNNVSGQQATVSLTTTGLEAGNYALKVVAWDVTGLATTSAPVNITVNSGGSQLYGLTKRVRSAPLLHMPGGITGTLPPVLSQTGIFADTSTMGAVPGLIPYSVNVSAWDDGAMKTRYFSIPNRNAPYAPEQQISFAPTGEWAFPNGSVFVQTFELATNEANPSLTRRLETRVLVRGTNGAAYGVSYKWRADNSDADLSLAPTSEDISIATATGTRTQTWYYPSASDCLVCHTPAANYVLGLNTRQLNRDFIYASTGQTDNQLRTFNRLGLLNPAIDEAGIANYTHLSGITNLNASLEERFRSYLDVNCATCHRPGGTGITTDDRYDTPLAKQNLINTLPAKGNLGVENARIVVPGDLSHSVLLGRMNTTNSLVKMPSLARNLIDTNGVQLSADWINSLAGKPSEVVQPAALIVVPKTAE